MNLPAKLRNLIGVFDPRLQLPYGSFGAQKGPRRALLAAREYPRCSIALGVKPGAETQA
jgi:hypothetical protein